MALTMRQKVSWVLKETAGATHFIVRFDEDGAVCTIPAKNIVKPSPADLDELSECTVRWSDKKTYTATVLAMGKFLYLSYLHLDASSNSEI